MTICATHGISENLCGCVAIRVEVKPDDKSRDFTALPIGERVRFAKALRTIEKCPGCGLAGVAIVSIHLKKTRKQWIHDAVVGPSGFVVGAQCVRYEFVPPKRISKKLIERRAAKRAERGAR